MFRASQHPSSGALKTVTATSGIGYTDDRHAFAVNYLTIRDDRHAFAVNYLTTRRKEGYSIGYNGPVML